MSRRSKSKHSGSRRSPACCAHPASPVGTPSQPAVQPHPHWLNAAVCLCLGLAVWAVFSQTLHHHFVNYDDPSYVYENRHVFTGLTPENLTWALTATDMGIWNPLVWLSFMIDYQLHGLQAGWFHVTNVLLHIANTLLLLVVLRLMGGGLWRSLFVTALFALHPLHVESVAWVTERKDVLSALFWMLTMWGYLRYVQLPGAARYLTALLFFALGLMAKPMLMTLPAVLLLLDWWPLGRIDTAGVYCSAGGNKEKFEIKQPTRREQSEKVCAMGGPFSPARILLEKLPFIVLALASLSITFIAQHQAGYVASLQNVSLGSRIANALIAYVMYLWKMLWPAYLYIPYLYSDMQPWWKINGAFCVLAGVTFAAVKAARRRGYFLFGWLWYLGTLIPVIGCVQVGAQTMADRYTYIPLIGIFIIIAWGAAELCSGLRYSRAALGSAAGAILASLLACAYVQTGYWKDSISLWTHTLDCSSENYLARNNMGKALEDQGKLQEAIEQYERALEIKPDDAQIHNNLGITLAKQGKLNEAIEQSQRALEIKPDHAKAHNSLGFALARQGRLSEAIEHFERALKINPDDAQAHNNLGNALSEQGRLSEAIEHFERALQLNPDDAQAHTNLGITLAILGRSAEAIHHFQQALHLAMSQNNTMIAEFVRTRLKSFPTALQQP